MMMLFVYETFVEILCKENLLLKNIPQLSPKTTKKLLRISLHDLNSNILSWTFCSENACLDYCYYENTSRWRAIQKYCFFRVPGFL